MKERQREDGGRRRMTIYCDSKLLPHLSSLFYFTSLPSSSHPACRRLPPAGTRICWEIKLVFNLGRESPASPQPSHTGIGEMCSWLWVSYLYSLLDYKKQMAFSYCALSLLSKIEFCQTHAAEFELGPVWFWSQVRYLSFLLIPSALQSILTSFGT